MAAVWSHGDLTSIRSRIPVSEANHVVCTLKLLVFVIFMLLGREDLRDRVLRLAGSSRLYMTTQALDDAARRVSRYLLMQLAVNAMYGALVGVGLRLIGVPNPLVWAVLATLLRFIPYVGPWIAAGRTIAQEARNVTILFKSQ
jgi:predicted PurR-regulated permease PerM